MSISLSRVFNKKGRETYRAEVLLVGVAGFAGFR